MTQRSNPNVGTEGAARLHLAAITAVIAALAFLVLFQAGKVSPFREVIPFGEDPYDAIGSIAVQLALFCALLSYARADRVRRSPQELPKAPLAIRGIDIVIACIFTTLMADTIAEASHQAVSGTWESALLLGLVALGLLAIMCAVLAQRAAASFSFVTPPSDLTPADAIDDLWVLVQLPLRPVSRLAPSSFGDWLEEFTSDRFFAPFPWLNPRSHPWRFATFAGLAAGALLLAFQFREGLPPSFASGLAVASIFFFVELAASLTGFALLGGFLGLRPAKSRNRPSA